MNITRVLSLFLIVLTSVLPLKADIPPTTTVIPPIDNTFKINNGQSIAFLGDSITQFGWDNPGGYVRQVIDGLKSVGLTVTPIPAGISGQTSADMLKRIQSSVIGRKPTWMMLSCGVNDVWHKVVGLDDYKKNVTSMVDQAQAAGIKVMIFTASPIMEVDNDFNKNLAPYNDFLRQFAKDRNLPLVDMNAAFWAKLKATPPAPGTTLLTVDGVHPNPEGNFVFASNILAAFGLTSGQIAQYETQWRQSDDAAGLYGGTVTANGTDVSSEAYNNLLAAAKMNKLGAPEQLTTVLDHQALRLALKAHEDEPAMSPQLSPGTITAEMNKILADLINALPPAPANATSTAASTPAPAPKTVRITTQIFMTSNAGISLATYNNLIATAKARKISLNDLSNAIFFQAVRDTAKAHDRDDQYTYAQIFYNFIPEIRQTFAKLLKAQPPAPTEAASESSATDSTPSSSAK